jgi:hemolysin activation/secretion protein
MLAVTNPTEPEELVVARLSQYLPLGPSGFAAGYEYGHVWSNPGGAAADPNIHVETSKAGVYLNYAILRSIERNLIGGLALWGKDIEVDVGGIPAARNRKRWISAAATYDDEMAGAALVAELALSQGLSGLGATGDNNDFRFATIDGSLTRPLTDSMTASLLFSGQYAFTALPSVVNFDLGGETYGRAFDGSAISGEEGYALVLELSQEVDPGLEWLTALRLFGFVDYGAVWNAPGRSDYTHAALGSAGVGLRARLGSHTMASAWVAVPYKDEPKLGAEGTTVRFTAGVQF